MRLLKLFSAILALALMLMACNSRDLNKGIVGVAGQNSNAKNNPTPQPPNDGVRRITTVELKGALDKGTAIVIDVRGELAFKEGHIKGARLIPATDILKRADELPRDKLIVTYCA